ncbi:ATP-binding protein [Pseudomaricurvus sp. HS19]|uniref:ATP-binding protein n=1 Tax=Pseudomaricurvus sp. HS19 TaxID=2692626 RepID=UPI0013696E35|nr:ATP-binding protein [Pseudomaricurvus sp. HS19]MYM64751.1 ATP-binding protein [Pseudomaricurvus sp. HS19]
MKAEFLGARASNTGDDFHEWWALRLALRLLAPDTSLTAVTVEGVNLDDKKGQELTEWDSVDCGLFYGGHTVEQAEKIVIEQLKYSSSTPEKNWTVSELTSSKSKSSNNSIIKGLADSFSAVLKTRPDLISTDALTIKLVSNRPIGADLEKSLSDVSNKKHEALRASSGLSKRDFKKFIRLFDFSDCGAGSRFEQEENAINEILNLTQSADRGFVLDLKDRVHKLMLPEATGSYITKETVLTWMNVSDPRALFPCPPRLKLVENPVNRSAATAIQAAMINGDQFICLHGEGGSGKTTVLKQIENLLPIGSVMITYDCYGAGTYMDSEAYRHRDKDAYLQIINETSARLRLPLLISPDSSIDFVKAFSLRIETASDVLKAQSGDALLVIVIDAADNTVTGAKQCKPEETSFIHELVKVGNLPSNVRLMISARTGRLDSLSIPAKYNSVEISNFSLEETALNVSHQYSNATEAWVEDFHNLSNKNPRVQSYAFDYAGSDPEKAIAFLRPNGKGLDQIFEARFEEAILKEGDSDTLSLVCSSLVALPAPVPKDHLASVVGISKERVNDIVSDLPGMRVLDDKVGFLDEDVEFFVRKKAEPKLQEAYQRSAAHFFAHHKSDEYSAMHLASALFSSGQGRKIIEIIQENEAPLAIKDQIIRREVQRQRLQLAMKVCRSAGDPADAIFTLLVGVEAIKTDDAVDKIIDENPDLAIHFASDTVGRNILFSSKTYESHGRFLSHIVAREAADKDFIAAREKKRILREWMNRRREDIERQEAEQSDYRFPHIKGWSIKLEDITAVAHSVLDMEGWQAAYEFICGWKPRSIHYKVALRLIDRLLLSGKSGTIQEFLDSGCIPEPWQALFSIPLALSGQEIDCVALEKSLCNKRILKYCDLKELERHTAEVSGRSNYAEMLLNGCEILAANGKDLSPVEAILEYLCPDKWRLVDNIYIHDILKNDVAFRAYSLLMRHRGLDVKIESYWIDLAIPEGLEEAEKNRKEQKKSEKHREIRESLSNLMSVYAVRADILLSNILPKYAEEKFKSALGSLFTNSWRMSREHYFEFICSRLSLSVANLSVIPDIDMNAVFTLSKACFKDWPSIYSSGQRKVISKLIKIPELRLLVVKDIYQRSVEVKDIKAAASEKISILLDLSRILLFVDKDEAREIFKIAVNIANDVDVDAMHDVSLFSTLSKNAKNHFSAEISQKTANQMAEIITEYGTLLEGYDHFPWGDAISAVAILDMAKAISLIGYWEDCDLVLANKTLPALMSTGLSEATISSSQAASLLNFCDDMSGEFLNKLASAANSKSSRQLIEEVARAELLRFNKNGSSKVCQALNQIIPYNDDSGYWHSALNQLIQFKEQKREVIKADVDSDKLDPRAREETEEEFLDGISLVEISFESPADFVDSIKAKKEEARSKELYIGADEILISVSRSFESKDRITFLNLLADDRVIDDVGYTWAKTLTDCINLWVGSSHAISSWREENLPSLIANHLGEFSYNEDYGYDRGMLKDAIDSLHLNREEAVSLLLDGLEKNSDSLPLTKIYSVIRLLADYCSDEQIADVTTRYINRLSTRLKIPTKATDSDFLVESALACQLYSFLGDVDTRVRWRAAHSIRASARVGDFNTIVALTALYDRKSMPGYREDNVPFYWLSARLWLIVTFDRIASETPEAVVRIASWLLDIATDQEFPHVLMRHFAKSCLMKLISGNFVDFSEQEIAAAHRINTSDLVSEKPKRRVSRGGFREGGKERRFSFDSLDTLRYVYPGAIECFAGVDEEMFLDEAEAWIIERWENSSDLTAWQNEPRKHKLERANYTLYSHSHGSTPTIERHSYYLEWHAMWCSLGSLMTEKALAEPKYDDDDYGTLSGFLRLEGLTQPPHWSSDLRCPTPLELRFHKPPTVEAEDWVATIGVDDFDLELGLSSDDGNLVVDSYHDIRTSKHRCSVRISSSLVSPDTGLSLIRALQTSDDSHDYRLPPAGHEFEIGDGPFVLRGWLSEHSGDARLDQNDVFNYGVRLIETTPSENVVEVLDLCRSDSYPVSWVNSSNGDNVFHYEAWGDVRDDSRQREYIHGDDVVSGGHRLKISSHYLEKYLSEVDLDLILEVEITRRASKDGITEYDEESKKEARYARLYLFRRTGEIVTTEGCVGTWSPSGD